MTKKQTIKIGVFVGNLLAEVMDKCSKEFKRLGVKEDIQVGYTLSASLCASAARIWIESGTHTKDEFLEIASLGYDSVEKTITQLRGQSVKN